MSWWWLWWWGQPALPYVQLVPACVPLPVFWQREKTNIINPSTVQTLSNQMGSKNPLKYFHFYYNYQISFVKCLWLSLPCNHLLKPKNKSSRNKTKKCRSSAAAVGCSPPLAGAEQVTAGLQVFLRALESALNSLTRVWDALVSKLAACVS